MMNKIKNKIISKQLIIAVFKDTLPVLTGYAVLGFGFGLILKSNGFGTALALAMSVFIYAGSMQYAAIGLLASGAPLITIALTTLMVNIRHLFYGISMIGKYKDTGKAKPYLIFALTDETYSLVCSDTNKTEASGENPTAYYFLVSMFNQIYWVAGSVLGALAGSAVKFNSDGIDFALTALFLTIFLEQWLSASDRTPAIIGIASSLVCLIIFGSETFLIPSMIIIALILGFCKEKNR